MGCVKFNFGIIRYYSFYLRKIFPTQRFFIFSNSYFYNIISQKNIPDDNKGMFGREDSIRITENKELDDKKINLIESK